MRRHCRKCDVLAFLGCCFAALLTLGATAAAAAPPANDDRSGAETLTASVTDRTLVDATTQTGEALTCGSDNYSQTVWFSYTAPAQGLLSVRVTVINRAL